MTDDLQQARVTAAMNAWRDSRSGSLPHKMRVALAAADAVHLPSTEGLGEMSAHTAREVPSVEQIAEVIHPGYGRTDGYCASCALAKDQARKIAALLGEVASPPKMCGHRADYTCACYVYPPRPREASGEVAGDE